MANDWIIDVLADLKTFASENGLLALASQLDETAMIAAAEIASHEVSRREIAGWDVGRTGREHRNTAMR